MIAIFTCQPRVARLALTPVASNPIIFVIAYASKEPMIKPPGHQE